MEHTPTHFPWPDFESGEGPWIVSLYWADIEGRLECTGVRIRHRDHSQPIETSVLRKLQLRSEITRWRKQRVIDAEFNLAVIDESESDQSRQRWETQLRAARGKGRHRRYDLDHYQEVARIYNEACLYTHAPTREVAEVFAEEWGVKVESLRNRAGKWVMECRKLGLIPPTEPRRAKGLKARTLEREPDEEAADD